MVLLFKLLIVLFSFLIIKSKGEQRLVYFYAALFLIPENISITPYIFYFKEHIIFITCFVISLILHKELNLKSFKNTKMFVPLVLVSVAYLLVGIMDKRLNWINGIYRATYTFEGTYFAFLVGWLAVNLKCGFNINLFLRKVLRLTMIATIFGVITFFLKSNPVLDAIGLEGRFENEAMTTIRAFRVTSFFVSSSVYGLVCGYLCLMGTLFLKNKKAVDIIALILLFLNCILSGTRAAIFPVLILFILYYALFFRKKVAKIMRFLLLIAPIPIFSYLLVPESFKSTAEQYSAMLMSVVDDDAQEQMGGSSIDARTIQMATAVHYLKEKPFFGHGMGYSKELLLRGKHEKLLGMESYVCFLCVEYGGVFTVCIIIFFISILSYFYKRRHVNKELAISGICMLLCYVFFLIYAWVGDSFIYIMPILGLLARMLSIKYNMQ